MIISASRRTDIPAFYAAWFMNRVRAGYCTVPNPFNRNQISRISLRSQDVDMIVFWTRNPRPLFSALDELDTLGYHYYFQFTIMDNPRVIDPKSPPVDAAIKTFKALADRVGSKRVIWRYDPIVLSAVTDTDFHYAIQDFFLTEKYVRKIDIEVMYEFLKTVTRQVSGRLYFTNDEAVTFFDRYRGEKLFEWPKFSERHERGYESCEHAEILDRGHQYQQKTNYINRILSVLYRIRPTIAERKHISFIESCQETGAQVVRLAPKDADAILKSNTYFGKLFREKGLDPTTLTEWLTSCREKDVFDFAEFLDLSIAETCALLRDIRSIDGSFKGKKWVSKLLDFQIITTPKYGPAEGKNSLTEWRDYAGAQRRASKPKAYERAEQGGHKDNPDENDWFGWGELCYSKGWEVKLGDVFLSNITFKQYLDAFMAYHSVREQNDKNAFQLLLTDYMGVNRDGSVGNECKRNCLRNVMLGYFKTGEVVLGGNCRSCSNCVPDGNFEQDIAKRRQLVQRLPEEFFEITQEAEQKTSALPSPEFTANFWQIVTAQEDRQRGLLEYSKGWTAKLLQDTPEHKTAMWFRLTGMAKQLIDSNEAEVIQYMGYLIPQSSLAELQQIEPVLNEFLTQFDKSTKVRMLRANLLQKFQRHEECASTWLQIVEMTKDDGAGTREVLFTAYSVLQRIYAGDGPLPDLRRYRDYQRMAARKAPDLGEATKLLQPLVTRWNWAELTDEIAAYKWRDWVNSLAPRLVKWWIEQHNSEVELAQVVAYIADNKLHKSWDAEATTYIIAKTPQSQHRAYPDLTVWWLTQIASSSNKNLVDATTFINDGVAMIQLGYEFSTATNERFIISIFREFSENQGFQLQEQLLGMPSLYDSIRKISIPFLSDLTEPEAMKWLDWFGCNPAIVDEIHNLWKTRAMQSSSLAAHYFKVLLQMFPKSASQTEDFALIILNSGDPWAILSEIANMPTIEPFIRLSKRLSLMLTHVSLLAQLTQTPDVANSRKITSQELDTILRMCRSYNLPSEQSDQMFAAILCCIWRRYPKWDTLPDRLLQAYNRAGLRKEAIEVAESHPTLLVGTARVPALQYARQITLTQDNLNMNRILKKITESCINRWAMPKLRRY